MALRELVRWKRRDETRRGWSPGGVQATGGGGVAPAARSTPPSPPTSFALTGRGVAAGFALGLLFWALALFALPITSSSAHKPLGATWDRVAIGYSADAAVAGYVANGMALWAGASALEPYPGGSDIRVVVAPLLPPVYYEGQTAQANLVQAGGRITGCEVRLDPVHFFALNETARQNTVTHELGHCFGLDHSTVPSVMMNPLFYGFTGDDAAGIAALYPPAPAATPEPTPPPPTPVASLTPASATSPATPSASATAPPSPAAAQPDHRTLRPLVAATPGSPGRPAPAARAPRPSALRSRGRRLPGGLRLPRRLRQRWQLLGARARPGAARLQHAAPLRSRRPLLRPRLRPAALLSG